MKVNDTSYWNEYYKRHSIPQDPSSFAVYVKEKYMAANGSGQHMVELGCGNGRDAVYFARSCRNVSILAVDLADEEVAFLNKNYSSTNLDFRNADFSHLENEKSFDFVYSRFTFHSIDEMSEDRTLDWIGRNLNSNGYFFLEVRSSRDAHLEKAIKDAHYRRYVSYDAIGSKVKQRGLTVLESVESQGLAIYKNEDPFIIRLVARKVA
jgi:tellurite methyltransferase